MMLVLVTGNILAGASAISNFVRYGDTPAIAQALRETGRYCDPKDDGLFYYSEAVTGVPGLLSHVAEDCRQYFYSTTG
jgi:hypothetical protein